ncbi:flagellar biosynthesis protein FlhA [Pseudoprimorskyibacter insulae]|uniref:Flagellar biosynthesis protein FlhA n=1 Tax=Pseudoprimorskyibacter insulae TaxID=1695997 RepID=A0A2R8AYW9_9RHOB|nr:flagellar biosynthesis protein FlhA [Pseudoprimorskyibacter insulae]SPF81223.1 Flagellar biosynthesis protein FlhA [Pseudoprimorskyibacter insulae]
MSRRLNTSVAMAIALMAIIVMMILPVPSWVLDVGLAASFSLAILIFTIALFVERPLDFSAFPTVLLASLMLRLSLNVSSTKLIIGQGQTGPGAAGAVIEGFASFVMNGSVFLGLVVFGVLMIVNFTVITKGATRMAEVGARFALDGMPGKQLAIDSDLSAGAITHEEAKARRQTEQQETTFFGSLDGASKFVRGDAVAGLLITLLNLIVGLCMGIFVHGMEVGPAFETYAILTVGDGLVSQIPAVIISFASALLLSRGGTDGAMDLAVVAQLGRYPKALSSVAVLMGLFALVPGLPFVPFMLGAGILGGLSHLQAKSRAQAEAAENAAPPPEAPSKKPIGDMLDLDDIHIAFAPDLVTMVLDPSTGLDARIGNMREHIATHFGFIMPEIRLTDDVSLSNGMYTIHIQGVVTATGVLHPDMMLALMPDDTMGLPDGSDVKEPVYGAPARWIQREDQEQASLNGATIVAPTEVLATHLLEIVKRNFPRLLTLKALRRILDEITALTDQKRADANRRLLDELIPEKIPLEVLHSVLRLLLAEQVSIRNMGVILETIAEVRGLTQQPESICELVRQRLGFQLVAQLRRGDGSIPLIQLAPQWEDKFTAYQIEGDRGGYDVALPPEEFEKLTSNLADQIGKATENGISAAVVTSSRRRRFLHTIMAAKGLSAPVLSFEEIGLDAKPSLVGMVPG